jgi:protease-4
MGAVAASGGYYVASAADEIWAEPSTVTGSIGIFYGKVDIEQLAGKLDVGIEHLRRGKRAGAESLYRPFTDDERVALADVMRSYYRLFLERVAEGRSMSVAAVDALARGRVFSGETARNHGLVDRLGGLASAIARARERAGLDPTTSVRVRPNRPAGLIEYMMGGVDAGLVPMLSGDDAEPTLPTGEGNAALGGELRNLLRAIVSLDQLGTNAPLALMPYSIDL